MRWLDSITDSTDMNVSKLREILKDREAWCAAVHGVAGSDRTGDLPDPGMEPEFPALAGGFFNNEQPVKPSF